MGGGALEGGNIHSDFSTWFFLLFSVTLATRDPESRHTQPQLQLTDLELVSDLFCIDPTL